MQLTLGEPGLNTPGHIPGACTACDRARAVLGHQPACCPAPRPASELHECMYCQRVDSHARDCRFARDIDDRRAPFTGRTVVVSIDVEAEFELGGEHWRRIVVYGRCWHPTEAAGRVRNLPQIGDRFICLDCLCRNLTQALNRGRFARRTGGNE